MVPLYGSMRHRIKRAQHHSNARPTERFHDDPTCSGRQSHTAGFLSHLPIFLVAGDGSGMVPAPGRASNGDLHPTQLDTECDSPERVRLSRQTSMALYTVPTYSSKIRTTTESLVPCGYTSRSSAIPSTNGESPSIGSQCSSRVCSAEDLKAAMPPYLRASRREVSPQASFPSCAISTISPRTT